MPSSAPARVTVVVPCRNEREHIAACLDSILASEHPRDCLEILVVDGMSEDGTRDIVRRYAARYPALRVLDNPRRITPAALNIGIAHARGELVVRMDAHTDYPPDYIAALASWSRRSGAENVGGRCITRAGAGTAVARAIAAALAHPFGVGNSYYRIGTAEPRWVDTVPFGCYRREVFDRIGAFDEELVRNQDDELNARLIRDGGRILLVPSIVAYYYARSTLAQLWRMYAQYGYFKPLVARKVGRLMTARQLAPSLFIVALALTVLIAPTSGPAALLAAVLLAAYALAAMAAATSVAARAGLAAGAAAMVVFPVLHASYGLGYLRGVLDFVLRGRAGVRDAAAVPISRL